MVSEKKLLKIAKSLKNNGRTGTLEKFGITWDTLSRYIRQAKAMGIQIVEKDVKSSKKLNTELTEQEVKILKKSMQAHNNNEIDSTIYIDNDCDTIKFGLITDTHIGSKAFNESWFKSAFDTFKEKDCQFVIHAGDVTEGLSRRSGHAFELTSKGLGYDKQLKYSVDLFNKHSHGITIYSVSGNHDNWYKLNINADIVDAIAKEVPNFNYLGSSTALLNINNVNISVWHGLDGSSNTTSYRPQKIVDSLSPKDYPDLLLLGHTHKQLYMYYKDIHVFSGGALCEQSQYMKEKRLENHSGFTIIELSVNKFGIKSVNNTWYPLI